MAGQAPPRVTWRGRMWRGLWPDHNPLRRASDRAEAAIFAALLTIFLITAPLAALAAGHNACHAAVRAAHAQASARRVVSAVLLASVPPTSIYTALAPAVARARWAAPDGTQHIGKVPAPANAQAGNTVTVWVTASGWPAKPPLTYSQVIGRAIFTAAGVTAALAIVLLGAAMLAHYMLHRSRLAAWDAEWRVTGPRWTSRH